MKVITLLLLLSLSAYATQKGIYGEDNRLEVYQVEDKSLVEASHSTASMISKYKLGTSDEGIIITDSRTLRQKRFVCEDEPFAKQMAPIDCSGFLVAPDIIVTAGHCMASKNSCKDNVWVFDYHADENGEAQVVLDKNNIYGCKELIEGALDPWFFGRDHAIIKLDRPVIDREPLKYRKIGKVEDDANLAVIGNPSGLPTKVTLDGHIRKNDNPYWFSTNLDAFGGNSGSAVLDEDSGLVEGILVRGDEDFYYDRISRCFRAAKYPMKDENAMGEHVTRITTSSYLVSL